MIYSMTAYARKEIKGDWGSAVWEIRSVNQRYLETYFRLPEQFRGLEPILRERFRKKLARGKVECHLRFEANPAAKGEITINQDLVKQVINAASQVMSMTGEESRINPFQVMNWPGVMETPEQDMDAINKELLGAFDEGLKDFIDARGREGANMKALIEQRLEAITEQVVKVRARMPEILEWQRERLLSKFEEAKIELDGSRVEQELILLAQKSDVAEELDRLDSHVKEANNILKKGGACGRKLDFMMQEFNRESNTLASKSISTDITASGVELKVLIEQMREQIQNIE
ncbi:putative stress-induced protein [Vibrio nigripulchritudo SFn27]|uniref:Putative stress-induced protein n=1 Tax=Vibrio nigripulchritudo TaxID=28173 RepID=U4KFQ6_9VIBR|nr:YicC/YloC family endoribonuclease [Vibrio nigripulchritudo]CCN80382.1 putative stress-induced protein [Vibrio nigripulchritudo BLFn1]CCN91306.1 putative stress-induced protein [Vibrio nigripulchritudo SFn27]CCN92609.1 putative stress-induced protein [Vibrio nigripulchritudo ENn2]CCO41013.1 putative stress-induced protein [Vibrio nigripulchritudo SFn135]CCO50558.1 putative stress-induced protein [Vibrio nigripulchritudo Wn13]